jgi:hypothetical protein
MAVKNGKENQEREENQDSNSPWIGSKARVISYNVNEGERPGGIKVRFKIRVATGRRADAIDARQAQVIREVLEWARQHRQDRAP